MDEPSQDPGPNGGTPGLDPYELKRRAEAELARMPDDERPEDERLRDALSRARNPGQRVERIRRALLDEAQDTRDAIGPARQEVPGTAGLLYRGVPAMLFGDQGSGKSTVALAAGLSAAAAGERVLYLDRENGAALTDQRIETLLEANEGWGDPLADAGFVGRHYPELSPDWDPEDFAEAVAGAGFTVVIFDSLREALAQLRLDPDSERDFSRFLTLEVTPLARRSVAVALLDNVGHQEKGRPKGSRSKLDAVPQAYKVTTPEKFSAIQTGRVNVTCTRSRYGDLGRDWTMRVGGGVFEAPTARSEAPDAKRAREVRQRREDFRHAVVGALRDEAPRGRDALIGEARKRGAIGRNAKLRDWLADLVGDPASGVISTDDGYDLAAPSPPGPEEAGQGRATPRRAPPAPGVERPYGPPPEGQGWPREPGPRPGPEPATEAGIEPADVASFAPASHRPKPTASGRADGQPPPGPAETGHGGPWGEGASATDDTVETFDRAFDEAETGGATRDDAWVAAFLAAAVPGSSEVLD